MHEKKLLALLISAMAAGSASALDFDFYGSVRVHGESVHPDKEVGPNAFDSYAGWRDAYSRIGFNAEHAFGDTTAYAKLELPLDIPNKAVQDPWNQDEDIRIGKLGLKGGFGDVAVGQMWMPYYNAIAYPVDMFSSYYSGFATYTTFRKGDTVAYYTPKWGGFSLGAAYSADNGNNDDDRWQGTVSYSVNGLTLAGGVDALGGDDDSNIWGASVAWQATDALYVGAKYEVFDSDANSGYGEDGDAATNLYAGYTVGKNTFKGMVADVEKYGETIFHLGWDYQYRPDLKFFVEYYSEEETAAITAKHGGLGDECWDCSGGYAAVAGLRYDFGAP
jgi:predicted porin